MPQILIGPSSVKLKLNNENVKQFFLLSFKLSKLTFIRLNYLPDKAWFPIATFRIFLFWNYLEKIWIYFIGWVDMTMGDKQYKSWITFCTLDPRYSNQVTFSSQLFWILKFSFFVFLKDCSVRSWNLGTGKEIAAVNDHRDYVQVQIRRHSYLALIASFHLHDL